MFTGIVEEVGRIEDVRRGAGGVILRVSAPRTASTLHASDSVAVNGVCLTVTSRDEASFSVQAVEETLRKTTLGELAAGIHVNIERPVRINEPLGGHFVLGHVDTVGRIERVDKLPASRMFFISFPVEYQKYVIPVGSIAVDGVSMTVAALEEAGVQVSVIPYTWENTIFRYQQTGDSVNMEFDVLGKYVERMLANRGAGFSEKDFLSEKHLGELGF